jgi:hypothetical protein
MNDLISRKVLNEYLDSQIKDVSESIPDRVFTKDVLKAMRTTGEAVKKYVSSMPDAYDVKKVVGQLENEYTSAICPSSEPCENPHTIGCCYDNAIRKAVLIAKKGAVKDE